MYVIRDKIKYRAKVRTKSQSGNTGFTDGLHSTWDKYQEMTKWKGIKYDCRTMKQRFKSFVVSIFRKAGVAPVSKKSVYVDVAPVD